jgi:hypothetical protein
MPRAIASVLEAVETRDADAIIPLLMLVSAACTEREGPGGPPKCWIGGRSHKEGDVLPEGTVIQVFPMSACEFGWYQGVDLLTGLMGSLADAGELYAVLRLTQPLFTETDAPYPHATHAALFTQARSPDASIAFATGGDGLVFIDRPCDVTAAAALEQHPRYRGAEVLVRGPAFAP